MIRATASVPVGAPEDFRLVAVYGFTKAAGAAAGGAPSPSSGNTQSAKACYTIQEKYANYGGPLGILGKPAGEERRLDDQSGRYQEFRGQIFGMTSNNTSIPDTPHAPMPTCSLPVGKFTEVLSTIYWTQGTCANIVQGEIREYWLRLGGPKSKLGYPIADETHTPDHQGRMSRFEHGEIWWYPAKGASERTANPRPALKR